MSRCCPWRWLVRCSMHCHPRALTAKVVSQTSHYGYRLQDVSGELRLDESPASNAPAQLSRLSAVGTAARIVQMSRKVQVGEVRITACFTAAVCDLVEQPSHVCTHLTKMLPSPCLAVSFNSSASKILLASPLPSSMATKTACLRSIISCNIVWQISGRSHEITSVLICPPPAPPSCSDWGMGCVAGGSVPHWHRCSPAAACAHQPSANQQQRWQQQW